MIIEDAIGQGKVFDVSHLKSGGNLFIAPFKAGAGVEATKQLNHVVLLAVKEIVETLQEAKTSLNIVFEDNEEKADFVLKGHVVSFKEPQGILNRWGLRKKELSFGIDCQMTDVASGEVILRFSHLETTREKNEGFESVARKIGREIGTFILDQLQ
ncbi:MAG: hypothetical protein WC676_08075 [Candidatus Omnitrophota bacterium]